MDNCFSVYPQTPPWYSKKTATELCPSKDLYKKYKICKISSMDFIDTYYEDVLEKLNPQKIAEKYDGCILLGWYKEDDDVIIDCRFIISFWLAQNNIPTHELTENELSLGLLT